jgi:hypothetical protein
MNWHRTGGIALFLLSTVSWTHGVRAEEASTPQQQVDRILREGIVHAKTQLEQEFSFLPFALMQHADGRIERILGPTGDELDPLDAPEQEADPARALKGLEERVAREAKAKGDLRVVGIFSDTEVKLPNGSDSDAIQAEMEQVSGYCADIFVPYGRVVNTLTYGDEISTKGKGLVFRCD